MAVCPRTQNKLASLALSMISGYTEHPDIFSNADIPGLQAALDYYQQARVQISLFCTAGTISADQKTADRCTKTP